MVARWTAILAALLCAATVAVGSASAATGQARPRPLDLGPAGLPESRTVQSIEPGVTLTRITRGALDPAAVWVVEVNIPGGPSSPDPDAPPRSIQDQTSAEAFAARLTASGFPSEAQVVRQPQVADVPAGVLGDRVRLRATFPTEAAASAEVARLSAAGFSGRAWYSGWDGGSAARGPGRSTSSRWSRGDSAAVSAAAMGRRSQTARGPPSSPRSSARTSRSTVASSCSTPRPEPRATPQGPASTEAACSPSRWATGPCSCFTTGLATPTSCDLHGPAWSDSLPGPRCSTASTASPG